MSDDKDKKGAKPTWMPLYVTEFIADTANLTAVQGWAYINLLCAMWRSHDGTLPNDADKLARVGKVHRPRWGKVWDGIKSLFDVDGDRVTSTARSGRAWQSQCLDCFERAAARIGELTTQFRHPMNAIHRNPMTAP